MSASRSSSPRGGRCGFSDRRSAGPAAAAEFCRHSGYHMASPSIVDRKATDEPALADRRAAAGAVAPAQQPHPHLPVVRPLRCRPGAVFQCRRAPSWRGRMAARHAAGRGDHCRGLFLPASPQPDSGVGVERRGAVPHHGVQAVQPSVHRHRGSLAQRRSGECAGASGKVARRDRRGVRRQRNRAGGDRAGPGRIPPPCVRRDRLVRRASRTGGRGALPLRRRSRRKMGIAAGGSAR